MKQSKKSFLPIISIVLSSLLFSFTGELKADETQGDATCSLGDSTSCATLNTTTDFSKYLQFTPSSSGVGYDLSYTQTPRRMAFPNVTLNANNTIINSKLTGQGLYGENLFNQKMKTTFNLKNSLWNGDLAITSDYYPDHGYIGGDFVFTVNFDGNYTDTTNPDNPLNGIAFKGNLVSPYSDGHLILNFKNGARWDGNLATVRTNGRFDFNFDNGSVLNGKISAPYGVMNANFTRKSSMKGGIVDSTGQTWNWTLDDSSIDATSGGITSQNHSTLNLTLKNNSSIKGGLSVSGANLNVNAFSGSKVNLTSLKGPTGGYSGRFNFTLDNSTLQGATDNTPFSYTHTQDLFTIKATNNSRVLGNVTDGNNMNGLSVDVNFNFTNSSFTGDYTVSEYDRYTNSHSSTLNFSGNNSTDGYAWKGDLNIQYYSANITLSNGAKWQGNANIKGGTTNITLDTGSSLTTLNATGGTTTFKASGNSSVTTINRKGGTSNYTFDNSSLKTYNVTGGGGSLTLNNNSTLDTLSLGVGYSTGITLNSGSTLKNVNFTKADAGLSITADNAHIGQVITYAYDGKTDGAANATLTLSNNSTIGTATTDGSIPTSVALGASWGNITATLDNSSVYGGIDWETGLMNATFKNNSSLIGNLGASQNIRGNITGSNNITFIDSLMKGDIQVAETQKPGKHTTLNTSFSGNSSFEGSIKSTGAATLNASFDGTKLNIKDISLSSLKADSTLSFTNISGAKIGNINFTNGTLSGDFSNSSLGNITNTNSNSSLILSNSAGQTYGNIGSSTATYNGSLKADFDFTPTDSTSSITTIGDMYLGANAKANLSFSFGGLDSTNQLIGKQSITDGTNARNVKITGGGGSSSYAFSNIGTLDLTASASDGNSSTPPNILDLVANKTGISLENVKGALRFSKTNIVLNDTAPSSATTANANSVFSLASSTSKVGINTGTSTFNALNATFGNATLTLDDTNAYPTIVANDPNDANNLSSFYTLNQNKPTGSVDNDLQESSLDGKTSNGDIGYVGDNVEKHISFVFTEGIFDKHHSGYTGTIAGGTANSTYSFYNSGLLNVSQITNYLGSLNLYNTYLIGVLGKSIEISGADGSITSTPKDVSIALDYSSSDSNPYGLAIVGVGKHNITLNFTGNHSDVKFAGSLLGGTTTKIAGSNNTDNAITIYGLEGLGVKQTDEDSSLLTQLHNAGLVGFNAIDSLTNADGTMSSFTDENSPSYIAGYGNVKDGDKKPIALGTTFKFLNTTFNSDVAEKDYALDLTFSSMEIAQDSNIKNANNDSSSLIANPNKLIPLTSASFKGGVIDLTGNIYDNKLSFLGEGSISNASNLLEISLGSGTSTLRAIDTGATVVLKNTDKVSNSSSLTLSNTSLIGDWSLGGRFAFGDSTGLNSKFYGKLSNTTSSTLDITLNNNSLLNADDKIVQDNYEGILKTKTDTGKPSFGIPSISFANTDNSKNKLTLNNPGGTLKIEGLSKTVMLSKDSSLISNNTSIIGDIYGVFTPTTINGEANVQVGTLNINLSFDNTTAKPTFYQGGSTDTISGMEYGSSLSFVGKGSLRSSKYDSTTGTDSGSVNINFTGSSLFNLTANNTGATINLNRSSGWAYQQTKQAPLNWNIRGTSLNMQTSVDGPSNAPMNWNLSFASSDEPSLLKTADGSLLTSNKDANGNTKDINNYIENSTFSAMWSKYRNGTLNINLIGNKALSSTSNGLTLANSAVANINLINMGNAFISDNTNLNNLLTLTYDGATAGSNAVASATINLIGTNIKDLTTNSTAKSPGYTGQGSVKTTLNAIFDTRELSDRKDSNGNAITSLQYYSNSIAMGNTNLEIAKSALSGKMTLDNNINANVSFYGNDSFTSKASISGGNNSSSFSFNDMNLNFGQDKNSQALNVSGKITLSNVAASGFLSSIGSGTISTANLKVASGSKASINNVLAFSNFNAQASSQTDLSNLGGIDYSSIKQGGSFKGTLATSSAMTYTFIGQNAQGFNTLPTIDETTSSISNKNDLTTLDSTLANATINVVDGGKLQTKNLEGTTKGNNNSLNLYGDTTLSMDENKTISVDSAGLSINAIIDNSNVSLWNGGVDGDGNASVDFNIGNSATDTDGSKSAIYNFTFNSNYSSPDYDHQFYKGSISGLSSDSSFTFNNAGFLKDAQINDTLAKIILNNTVIKGDISVDKISLDFRPQVGHTQGVEALSGNIIKSDSTNHAKDISFDFTGNSLSEKISNDSATDKNYYLAGDKGSKFTFINLEDNTSKTDVPETDTSLIWQASTQDSTTKTTTDAIFNTLQKSGVHLRAAKSTSSIQPGGEKLLEGDSAKVAGKKVPQNLDPDSTFNFYGSNIHSLDDGSISSSYSLGFIFDSRENEQERIKITQGTTPNDYSSTLNQSSYYGSSISSDKDLSIALYGKDAFKNDSNTLTLKAGNNRLMNITAISTEGSMGNIVLDNSSSTPFASGSSLTLSNVGFKGVYLTSRDNTDSKNPKGGDINANFDDTNKLGDGSILGTKDGNLTVAINYTDPLQNQDEPNVQASIAPKSSSTSSFVIGNGKSTLTFANAGVINIYSSGKSFADTITNSTTQTSFNSTSGSSFGANSTLSSNGTSIIGDIYGGVQGSNKDGATLSTNLNLNLSFDSTTANPTFYQGGSTDTIQGMQFGSTLSFVGKGSLRSSKYDSTTGVDSGSVNINFLGNNLFNLTANNTGATLNLNRVAQFAYTSPKQDITWNVRGTSINMLRSIDGTINSEMNWNLSFASSGEPSLLNTADGSLLTSNKDANGNAKDINDYIENSTLAAMWSKYRNGTLNITLIGDKALKSSDANMTPNTAKANVNINLINMGNAFVGNTNASDGTTVANNTNLNNLLTTQAPEVGGAKENILILGTNIENASTNTDAGVNVSLGAIFDNRDLKDRLDSNGNAITSLQYYSNSIAMGNTNLEIAKSALLGTFTLDPNLSANIAFYGKDAISSSGKILGGNSKSNVIVSLGVQKDASDNLSYGSFDFSSTKGFKGNVYVLNTTLSSPLEDKKGVTLSDGSNISAGSGLNSLPSGSAQNADGSAFANTDPDASLLNTFTITFNDNKEGLKAGLDAYNENHKDQIDTDSTDNTGGNTDSTPPSDTSSYLSSDASAFITDNIIGTLKDANGNALDLDLNNVHSIDKAIGYTTSALNVNFIGANSIKGAYNKSCTDQSDPSSCTYSPTKDKNNNIVGFYIHDDNANNVYNFIDFGKIDVLTFAQDGVFNGQINWVGHSYQIGLIKNGLSDKAGGPMVIDFDNLPDKEVANNIYQATNGIQNILFDFGGSTTTSTDTYKMNGAILQGDKTQDSSYTFSNLGKIDISSVDATLGSGADFYDVLNKTINGDNYGKTSSVTKKDLSALQLTKGTIGITNTSITGDITWNKKPAKNSTAQNPSYDRDITLKANFDDTYALDGSLKGDGNKDITFNGESSFKKDATTIEGTDASSNYTFNNVGLITQSTLNNLLNAGSDDAMQGKASNAGNFDFEGGSVILANITDAKDTQNISNQTINLGQKSDKGVMIRGEISTSAKVNAKFGVGSIVDIENKNDKSSYDFSSLATSNAPIVASINLNTNDTQGTDANATDGIKKATIIGLDKGNVSLIGSINDSDITSADETNKDATVTTNNIYQFGNASATDNDGAVASWLLTADSKVKQLNAFNTDNNALSAALASSTFSNAGSVIDLRGARMLAKTQNNSDTTMTGSMRADSGDSNTGDFTSVTLDVENANLNKALFRLGVDTNTNTADQIIISQVASNADGSSTASTSSNALQVYLDQGSLDVNKPILLAQASTSQGKLSSNYFFGAGYSQGLYFINPEIVAVDNATINPPSDKPNTPDTGATPDDTSKPADTTGKPSDTTSTVAPDAGSTTTSDTPATPTPGADTSTATPNTGADTTGTSTTAKADTTSTTALAGALATSGIKAADTDSTNTDSANTDTTPKDTSNADLGKSMSWYLTGFNASADTSITSTLSSTLGTFYRDFRIATNNLNLRMGELRNNSATQGVWARVINGMGSDTQNNKDFYTTLQAGYDYQFDVLGGVNYLGVDAEASMVSSKGDAYTSSGRNLGVGIYNTYIMDNGFYVDASAKYLNLGNRISIANSALLSDSTSNLTSNAFLLGAEVGYRYSLDTLMKLMKAPSNIYTKGYYIEPQLEMIYGYITGNNYDVSVNNAPINVALSGSNALISRLGAVLGKHFKYDNGMLLDIRVGLSYINELNTGGKTTLTQESGIGSTLAPISLNTAANNKLNLSLGANVKLSDDWRLYADVSRTFLGTYNFDYNLNVGARFSFGKKMSDLEKQIKADKNKKQEDKVETSNKKTEAKEKSKLLEEKKTVKLDTKGAKVGCQGCLPEAGLYLQVAVLAQKDSSALKEISKHSYRAYEFELTSKDKKKQKVTRYLIGPFKNIQEVYENKKLADRIVQDIDGDKKAYAIMYEVK